MPRGRNCAALPFFCRRGEEGWRNFSSGWVACPDPQWLWKEKWKEFYSSLIVRPFFSLPSRSPLPLLQLSLTPTAQCLFSSGPGVCDSCTDFTLSGCFALGSYFGTCYELFISFFLFDWLDWVPVDLHHWCLTTRILCSGQKYAIFWIHLLEVSKQLQRCMTASVICLYLFPAGLHAVFLGESHLKSSSANTGHVEQMGTVLHNKYVKGICCIYNKYVKGRCFLLKIHLQ